MCGFCGFKGKKILRFPAPFHYFETVLTLIFAFSGTFRLHLHRQSPEEKAVGDEDRDRRM